MRERFADLVERGRIKAGPDASKPGEPRGMFLVRHPNSSRPFLVIATDDDGWDHVSVTTRGRAPEWPEMVWIKQLFFKPDEFALQIHRRQSDHFEPDHRCLHLWRPQDPTGPLPRAHVEGPGPLDPHRLRG